MKNDVHRKQEQEYKKIAQQSCRMLNQLLRDRWRSWQTKTKRFLKIINGRVGQTVKKGAKSYGLDKMSLLYY
jgi:hypothetical protein